MSDEPIIAARGLTKRYGKLEAVKGIDFQVERARSVLALELAIASVLSFNLE